jgi:hypothetical protein
MTQTEYEMIIKEAADRVKRTTFPPVPKEDRDESEYELHSHHVEFGGSRH